MIYQGLYDYLHKIGKQDWSEQLAQLIDNKLRLEGGHGNMSLWQSCLDALPEVQPSDIDLKQQVKIGKASDIDGVDKTRFIELLKEFHPWRKGPYSLFDINIDTEWHSDWKWDRVSPHISSLDGRSVLDVGGGNGYHGWRMLGDGAEFVLGIDPTIIFVMQYQIMRKYIGDVNHYVVPAGIEDLPANLNCFDTVFSMGVLYHRRSPLDHLLELKSCLKPGGELVVETLVVDGELGYTLMPEGRYAKMRNVWFLPSVDTMLLWLARCGFKNARCVDVNVTSVDEQRVTDWMTFESLEDFLDPDDQSKTIEGHPAPKRAVFIANA
jgi:tRNA (mo5U34)-methyltransferase